MEIVGLLKKKKKTKKRKHMMMTQIREIMCERILTQSTEGAYNAFWHVDSWIPAHEHGRRQVGAWGCFSTPKCLALLVVTVKVSHYWCLLRKNNKLWLWVKAPPNVETCLRP